jgi:hypothetical protein
MRLALFVAAMGLLYLIGIQALLPNVLLAGVISMLLSYLLLSRPREELSQQIADKVSGRLHAPSGRSRPALGLDDDAEAEDDAVDRAVDRAAERTAAERTAADGPAVDGLTKPAPKAD